MGVLRSKSFPKLIWNVYSGKLTNFFSTQKKKLSALPYGGLVGLIEVLGVVVGDVGVHEAEHVAPEHLLHGPVDLDVEDGGVEGAVLFI